MPQPIEPKPRCFGAHDPLYARYHDEEWGLPVHDDQKLFEMLILEGAQAGLSWETVLKKREGYRLAFHHFDIPKVAQMSDQELEALRQNPGIVRNRLKIQSARKNARVALQLQSEFGSLDAYLWGFVGGQPIQNPPKALEDMAVTSPESDALSKDLKKRGMSFVGSTIIYAFMQAVGMVQGHGKGCWKA